MLMPDSEMRQVANVVAPVAGAVARGVVAGANEMNKPRVTVVQVPRR